MHFNIKLKMLEYMIKKSHTPTFIIEPYFIVGEMKKHRQCI
ncbi:MAG: hypothetical protein K0S41_3088 [Anaerocolumna sp.]|nr:hypothetical protein [Anaerocolumna sp.]